LKILFICNGFPPHRWAGTETYTAGIAKAMQARGHLVQILCAGGWQKGSNYWNGHEDDFHEGVPVRRLNLNWKKAPDPFRYLYDNPVVGEYLAGYLEEVRPDLVHVTSCETLSASVLRVVKEAGLPLVLSLTDFWFLCPRINLLRSDGANCDGQTTPWDCLECQLRYTKAYRWARRILPDKSVPLLLETISQYPQLTRQRGLRGMAGDMGDRKAFLHQALSRADCRLTASRFVHDIFVANGVTDSIEVQPYGHDLSWLGSYTGKTASDTIRVGFIGQIIKSKGVHLLLQAVRSLPDACRNKLSLSIYGNLQKVPAFGARLNALAENISNIQFCGTYPHDQSAAVFANIDILVVPSVWYDFPLIIYEAFATKTPVIATDLGGMAEAVRHEVNGLLFKRNNVADLANQLRRIVEEPGLLERFQTGIPAVKTIETEVTELETIYQDLVAHKQYQMIDRQP
jgi:glycosyltransferase involved in cell wall biosynthesis